MAETTGGNGGSGGAGGAGGSQVENLVVGFQTQGAEDTEKSMDRIGTATIRTVNAISDLSRAQNDNAKWMEQSRNNWDALNKQVNAAYEAEKEVLKVTQARIDQGTAYLAKLQEQAATFNMVTGELQRYKAEQLGVSQEAEQYISAMERMREATRQYGVVIKDVADIEKARLDWEGSNTAALTAQRTRAINDQAKLEESAQTSLNAQRRRALDEQAAMEESATTALNAQRRRALDDQAKLEESAQASLSAQRRRALDDQEKMESSARASLNAQRIRELEDQAKLEEASRTSLNAQRIREINDQAQREESARTALNAQRIRAANDAAAAEKAALDEQQRSQTIFQAFKTRSLNDNAKEAARLREEMRVDAVKAAEKTAIEEIKWAETSLKQRIDILQRLKAFQANPAIQQSTINGMFSQAAMRDLPKLTQLIDQYNASLGGHGKKLGEATEAMGLWDRALGNNRVRTEAIVLAHEALQGRFTRMPGSLMVMGEYLTAANVPIGAMAAGFLGVAAAIGFFTYEAARGQEQSRDLANQVQRTNGYAGETRDSLEQLAHSVGKLHGEYTEAYKAASLLTSSGKFTADQIDMITKSAAGLSYAFGQEVNVTVREFESLVVRGTTQGANGLFQVTKAVEKLDEKYHFLTVSQMQTIIQLEQEGKARDASILAIKLYGEETEKQSKLAEENIGWIAKAWHGVTAAVKGAIQAMADVGKKDTYDNREKTLLNQLQKNSDGSINTDESRMGRTNKMLLQQYYALEEEIANYNKNVQDQADKEQKAADAKRVLSFRAIEDVRLMRKETTELQAALAKFDNDNKVIEAAQPGYMKDNEEYLADRRAAIIKAHTQKTQAVKDDGRRIDLLSELKHQDDLLAAQMTSEDGQLKMLKDSYKKGSILQDSYYEQATKLRNDELTQIDATEKAKLAILDKYSPKDGKDGKRVNALRQQVEDQANIQRAEIEAAQKLADQQNAEAIYNKMIDNIDRLGRAEVKKINELIDKQREHNAVIGMTAAQADAARANRQLGISEDLDGEAAAIEALLAHTEVVEADGEMRQLVDDKARKIYEAELARIQALIAARTEYSMVLQQGSFLEEQAAAQKKLDQDWERTNKKIETDLASAIVDGGGRGFKKLIRDMEIAFAKTVLQPILAPISAGITNMLYPGATQAGGVAGASGGTGASGYVGMANAAASAYKAASAGVTGFGSAVSGTIGQGVEMVGGWTGSSSMTAFGQGMQGFGLDGSLGASGAAGAQAASLVGSAAVVAAGLIGGHYIGGAISGGYGIGDHEQAVNNTGTASGAVIGAVLGGPIGAAIGAVLGGVAGGLLNRAFGMKDKEIRATGLRGTISDSGSSGESYSNWHQDGGWFRSDRDGTNTAAFDTSMMNTLTNGLASMKSAVGSLADTLGVGKDALQGYSRTFDILVDPLKEVKGSAAEQARIQAENQQIAANNAQKLADVFKLVGDDLANRLIPNIQEFAVAGETSSQTMERLASVFKQTNQIATLLGKSVEQVFGSAGLGSDAARERLLNLAGGADNLSSLTANYAQNFLTDAEKLAPVQKAVAAAMADLGLASVTTREQFKATVSALDLTTEKDAKLFVSLMQLQDAFATITDPIADGAKEAAQAVTDAKDALKDAYENEVDAINKVQDRLKAFISTMKDMRDAALLGDKSPLTPEQKYLEAKAQFDKVASAAKNGDEDAQDKFQGAFEAFLEASRLVNASGDKYQQDFQYAMQASRDAEKYAQQQVDIGQATLDALAMQVKGLIEIDNSVKTVAMAIHDLAVAMGKAGMSTDPITQNNSAAIESLYGSLFSRHSDSEGLAFWTNVLNQGFSLQDVIHDMMQSTEYQSTHGGTTSNTVASASANVNAPLASQTATVDNGASTAATLAQVVTAVQSVQTEIAALREDAAKQTGDLITTTVKSNNENAEIIASRLPSYKQEALRESVE